MLVTILISDVSQAQNVFARFIWLVFTVHRIAIYYDLALLFLKLILSTCVYIEIAISNIIIKESL